ncbi:MAG: cell division protein FtsZ [Geminicoccaceae bacterium]
MGINLQLPNLTELKPRITVIGVGGAGGNAINNMIATGISGVDFVVANTDAQALAGSSAEHRIQLGVNLTEGLGAGSKPEIGEAAAEEAMDEIRAQISGSHMVFVAAGMGGGTGTGAASVIARAARDFGILTVAVVTKPFHFEGNRRMRIAEAGIAELARNVDTLIVIPNQNLFRIANEKTSFADAFRLADQVLHSGIACITDLIVREGLINLDFADVRTVMAGMGSAMMGTGEAAGERRAIEAAELAILNPLLDDVSLRGAKGLLISISGSREMTLYEVDEAASRIRSEVDADANIIVGATFDETLGEKVRVSIVASGLSEAAGAHLPSAAPSTERGAARHEHRGHMHERSGQAERPAPHLADAAHRRDGGAMPAARDGEAARGLSAGHGAATGHAPLARPGIAVQAGSRSEPATDDGTLTRRLSEALAPGGTGSAASETQRRLRDEPALDLGGVALGGKGRDDDRRPQQDDSEKSERAGKPAETSPRRAGETADDGRQERVWQGPGDVVIELGPPQLGLGRRPGAEPAETAASPAETPATDPGFTPRPPMPVDRPVRRIPEVQDFPTVGQREYLAKRGPVPEPTAAAAVEKRRQGLFARLTGRGRDSLESQDISSASGSSAGPGGPHTAGEPDRTARAAGQHTAPADRAERPGEATDATSRPAFPYGTTARTR